METHIIKIEKNIPIPEKPSLYPWAQLEVGDSFVAAEEYSAKKQASLSGAGYSWAKRNDSEAKFRAREHEGTLRVWRIK